MPPASTWASLAVVLLLCGCPNSSATLPTAEVSGAVTWKGQPVARGQIQFLPSEGPSAQGPIVDGTYRLEAVPVGDCKVSIEAYEDGPEVAIGPGKTQKSTVQIIPEKYNTKTELDAAVFAGPNTFDFSPE
jgi:hypothetical protein